MESARKFTTMEAAYLASACLAADDDATMAPRQVLFRAVIGSPPAAAPVTERAVNKAIEEKVVAAARATPVRLDEGVVFYLASARRLAGVRLSREAKASLYRALRSWRGRGGRTWRWKIAPALYYTPGPALGRWQSLLRTYISDRERYIAQDPAIMGGTPVIRGTRITVHSVLARLAGGDTVDDLTAEYPELPAAAFEAAAVHARTHPRRGRPVRRSR